MVDSFARTMSAPSVTVVGAGVVGLATAISLAEAGIERIDIIAKEIPGTTSLGSGALWRPVFYEGPNGDTFAKVTYDRLRDMMRTSPVGLTKTRGCELYMNPTEKPPSFSRYVENFVTREPGDMYNKIPTFSYTVASTHL
eukprot:m.718407 g.718407  ORF g.718407 m.718407 type:complete len:140 (+) comp22994_c2_seq2:237-656(+)